MGTLYVSALPAGSPDDWPLRAQRRLPLVLLVAAENLCAAQQALRCVPVAAPLVGLTNPDLLLRTLETGDVMLLLDGALAAPPGPAVALIHATIDRGFRVESVPGPALPITALVVSGLPADSFVYLGRLPSGSGIRRDLLSSVAPEKRTLVLVTGGAEPGLWDALYDALGARPAVLCAAETGYGVMWRGTLGPAGEAPDLPEGTGVLVIRGTTDEPARWTEERLSAEIRESLGDGLSSVQVAKQLAAPSGWPRRTIYRMAIRASSPTQEESNNDGV